MDWVITSNFPMKGNGVVARFILERAGPVPYLYLGYSPSAEKYQKRMADYGFSRGTFRDLSRGAETIDPEDYGLVVFHGGIPGKVKRTLLDCGIMPRLERSGGMGVCMSGSSCAFSKEYRLIRRFYPSWDEDVKGLGLFPFEVLPHAGRYRACRDQIAEYGKEHDLLVIEDGQGVFYDGRERSLVSS